MTTPILRAQAFSRLGVPADPDWIRGMIPEGVLGAYLLLRNGRPFYAGRSDSCLATRLAGHELLGQATHLLWEICDDPVRAFYCEAFLYDSSRHVSGFLNRVHPARPAGSKGECPFCSIEADQIRSVLERWRAPAGPRPR